MMDRKLVLQTLQARKRRGFTALLCLMLVIWSLLPATHHAPKIAETVTDHIEMIADHGHSHGFFEDMFWAMHGHGNDVVDHDHSKVFLVLGSKPEGPVVMRDNWTLARTDVLKSVPFRIDRPPRA